MSRDASYTTSLRKNRVLYADKVIQEQTFQNNLKNHITRQGVPQGKKSSNYDFYYTATAGAIATTANEQTQYIENVFGIPRPTILISVLSGNEQLTVYFRQSQPVITDIMYSIDGGSSYNSAATNVSPFVIRGLTNITTYNIVVKAVNTLGVGDASNSMYGIPLPGTGLMLFLDGGSVTDTSSTVWNDKSMQANNAVLYNSPRYDSSVGGFYAFDGTNQYAQVPSGFANFSSGLTILAFVNFGTSNNWERIIDFGNGTQSNNIIFGRNSGTNNLVFEIYNGVNQTRSFRGTYTNAITNSTWGFFAARIDGTACKLWKNTTSTSSSTTVLPDNITRTQNYIGRSNWPDDSYFNGYMGVVSVYNSPLDDTDVTAFFDTFKGRYGIS